MCHRGCPSRCTSKKNPSYYTPFIHPLYTLYTPALPYVHLTHLFNTPYTPHMPYIRPTCTYTTACSRYEPCVAHSTCPLGSGCAGPATIQAKELVGYWELGGSGMWGNDWNWGFCGKSANCINVGFGNPTCSNEVKCKEAAYNTQTNAYCDAPRGNGQMKLAYVADNFEDPKNAFGNGGQYVNIIVSGGPVTYSWYVFSPSQLSFVHELS